MSGQTFEKEKRILNHGEFKQTYDAGRKKQTSWFTLYWNKASAGQPTRFGVQVSKRCGNAVRRNAIKRRFRELIRTYPQPWQPGYNVVLMPRPGSHDLDMEQARKDMYHILNTILT